MSFYILSFVFSFLLRLIQPYCHNVRSASNEHTRSTRAIYHPCGTYIFEGKQAVKYKRRGIQASTLEVEVKKLVEARNTNSIRMLDTDREGRNGKSYCRQYTLWLRFMADIVDLYAQY